MNHITTSVSASSTTDPHLPAADHTAVVASRLGSDLGLESDLGRRLSLVLLEAVGEGHSAYNEFYQRLAAYQEFRLLHEPLRPGAHPNQIEQSLATVLRLDVDAVLVWAEPKALLPAVPEEAYSLAWQWPRNVLEAAERLNVFDRCFVALVGEDVDRRDARRLGYEDGFTSTISLGALAERLKGEALVRAETRRRGSSPPCYL